MKYNKHVGFLYKLLLSKGNSYSIYKYCASTLCIENVNTDNSAFHFEIELGITSVFKLSQILFVHFSFSIIVSK